MTNIILPATLHITKYIWLIFFLFTIFILFFKFRLVINVANQ